MGAAETRRLLWRVCLLLSWAMETGASSEVSCTFHGKKYHPGDSWHPYLEPQGMMYCLECTCSEDMRVNCYQLECPALHCPNLMNEPHQCCPKCLDLHAPSELKTPPRSPCEYNGTLYEHGNIFTKDELFPSRQPNQCSQCSCYDGQIYCSLVTCSEPFCTSPQTVPGSCCQVCGGSSFEKLIERPPLSGLERQPSQCVEEVGSKGSQGVVEPPLCSSLELIAKNVRSEGTHGTTVKIILVDKNKRACVYKGKTYSHGEVWHPHIHFALPCILCSCRDGVQDCQRIVCPKEYPCEEPESVEGKCCKVCPGGDGGPFTAAIPGGSRLPGIHSVGNQTGAQ